MESEDIKAHIKESLTNLIKDKMVDQQREGREMNEGQAINELIEELLEIKLESRSE